MLIILESMKAVVRLSCGTRAFDRIRPYAWAVVILVAPLAACNRDALGAGDTCTRSSECGAGLVCVEGACSASLAGLGNPGTVPMVMMGGEGMEGEGGPDAGAAVDSGAPLPMAGTGSAGTSPAPAGSGATPSDAGAMGMPDAEPGFQP